MDGLTYGRYRITGTLGRGGMAEVFAAKHELVDRDAAIKLLNAKMSTNEVVIKRFIKEAYATARIKHPGIVEIFDVGQAHGRTYIIMERLFGETLSARLQAQQRLPLDVAVTFMRQLAGAVGAAHDHGIVHRDLKPDNIFIVADPEVAGGERIKVLDFGLAKLTENNGTLLTQQGALFGTPAYMAPEQCRDSGSVDSRADVYSIGCIFFKCICGRLPFEASRLELLHAHLKTPPTPPQQIDPSIPDYINDLIMSLLVKDRDKRLQTCRELVAALDAQPTTPARNKRTLVGQPVDPGFAGYARPEHPHAGLPGVTPYGGQPRVGLPGVATEPVTAQAVTMVDAAPFFSELNPRSNAPVNPLDVAVTTRYKSPHRDPEPPAPLALPPTENRPPEHRSPERRSPAHHAPAHHAPAHHHSPAHHPPGHRSLSSAPTFNGGEMSRQTGASRRALWLIPALALFGVTASAVVFGLSDEPAQPDSALTETSESPSPETPSPPNKRDAEFEAFVEQAQKAIEAREWDRALDVLDRAVALGPRGQECSQRIDRLRKIASNEKASKVLQNKLIKAAQDSDLTTAMELHGEVAETSVYHGEATAALDKLRKDWLENKQEEANELFQRLECEPLEALIRNQIGDFFPDKVQLLEPLIVDCQQRHQELQDKKLQDKKLQDKKRLDRKRAASRARRQAHDKLIREARAAFNDRQYLFVVKKCKLALKQIPGSQVAMLQCALAECRMKKKANAQSWYKKLTRARKQAVKKACAARGIKL